MSTLHHAANARGEAWHACRVREELGPGTQPERFGLAAALHTHVMAARAAMDRAEEVYRYDRAILEEAMLVARRGLEEAIAAEDETRVWLRAQEDAPPWLRRMFGLEEDAEETT